MRLREDPAPPHACLFFRRISVMTGGMPMHWAGLSALDPSRVLSWDLGSPEKPGKGWLMRKGLLAAVAGLLAGLGTGLADQPPREGPAPAEESAPAEKDGKRGGQAPSPEVGLTFGRGLPAVAPEVVPDLPPPAANSPFTPLYLPPPPGPDPDALNRPVPGGGHFWGDLEYLNWWMKNGPLPSALPGALLTTGAATDAVPGALGQRNTQGVYDRTDVPYGGFAGMRATAGGWLDGHHCLGVEGGGFLFERRTNNFVASSDPAGNPLLAFRHLDPLPRDAEDAFVAAAPAGGRVGPFAGGVGFDAGIQLWGTEVNLLHALCWGPCLRVRLLGGFRYLDLDEDLDFFFQRTALGRAALPFAGRRFPAGSFELADDVFRTRTQFYGGQVGADGQYFHGPFFVGGGVKVAFGQSQERLTVFGQSALQPAKGGPLSARGGLFALPSNSGRFDSENFSVVPHLQGRVGVQATTWLRGFVGYEFLYWSGVVRPGSQVDQRVDPRQVPTDPAFTGATAAPAAVQPRRLLGARPDVRPGTGVLTSPPAGNHHQADRLKRFGGLCSGPKFCWLLARRLLRYCRCVPTPEGSRRGTAGCGGPGSVSACTSVASLGKGDRS
jgi:Putative beta barrel porin-7 (BBP7)